MKKNREIRPGDAFGRWTALRPDENDPGRWVCRCACGTEKSVLKRSLVYGGSLSCGCLKKDRAADALRHDLAGRVFGDLRVIAEGKHDRRGVFWRCACGCGREIELPGSLLVTGRKTHCGCKSAPNYAFRDISGQKFHRLTALFPLKERDSRGNVVWHCRCDCGREVDYAYNVLAYSSVKSCGCRKKENDRIIQEHLSIVDGTSLDSLKSDTLRRDNTSGVRGVYRIRGKYAAKIVFQGKQYHLGFYTELSDAAEVRKMAEEQLRQDVLPAYEKWKLRAEADPGWAEANPVRLIAEKDGPTGIRVTFTPDMEKE